MTIQDEINAVLKEGENAYLSGKTIEQNPYSLYSEKGQRWQRGFANAKYFQMLQSKK